MSKEQKITDKILPPNKDLEILKQNFPNCFDKNGEFDFEKFKTQLSKNEINFSKESYGMDWLGKSYARLLATDETTTLLKEDETFNQKEENKNSQNLLIKGDNLEVLKHLSNAYYEKIKMIYIDPPYNTGSDGFVYADNRKFTLEELQELAGVSEERAKRILDFTQSKSNSHSAWLTFMYPRLYIAKQLLKDDGVIFISIDDNEVAQLKLLMDEIFGEENFLSTIANVNNPKGRSDDKYIATSHEYVLVYQKSDITFYGWEPEEKVLRRYNKEDANGTYREIDLRKTGDNDRREDRTNLFYYFLFNEETGDFYPTRDLNVPSGYLQILPTREDGSHGNWRWELKTAKSKLDLLIPKFMNVRKKWTVSVKDYLTDNKRVKPTSSWTHKWVNSERGTEQFIDLGFDKRIFKNPKPIGLLNAILKMATNSSDIILDFFAGSGTTGDALMQLNAEENGNRKFILAQLPELIDPKNDKTAYDFVKNELKVKTPTIFEITKERLIRASKKIQEQNVDKPAKSEKIKCEGCGEDGEHCHSCKGEYTVKIEATKKKDLSNQDLGFKVFETIPIWEDYNFESEELEKQTSLFDESKLTQEDIKALLVTWKTYDNVPLTKTIQGTDLNGYEAHYSSEKLYLMDKGFTTRNLKVLLEKIDSDKSFNPTTIIAFGYHFESKNLREIGENIKSYANKKSIDIDFITRY